MRSNDPNRITRLLLLVLSLAFYGCAATSFAELAQAPLDDAAGPRATLAAAEAALLGHGDVDQARQHVRRATKTAAFPAELRPRAALLLAALGSLEGRPEWVLDALVLGLHDAQPTEAELLLATLRPMWGQLQPRGEGPDSLRAHLTRLADKAGDDWICVRQDARAHLLHRARLTPGQQQVPDATTRAGIATAWRISAPWGQEPLLDLALPMGPETRSLGATEHVRDGMRHVRRDTWVTHASQGELAFFDLPPDGAIGFAQTHLTLPASVTDRRVNLTLESNRPYRLFANGQEVLSHGEDAHEEPWVRSLGLHVPATGLLLTLKMAAIDGSGFARLRATPADPVATAIFHAPAEGAPLPKGGVTTFVAAPCLAQQPVALPAFPDGAGLVRAFLRLESLTRRPQRNLYAAGALMEHLGSVLPDFPGTWVAKMRLLAADRALGLGQARGKRQSLAGQVLTRWPDHVPTLAQRAKLEWAADRALAGIRDWRHALRLRPSHLPTLIALLGAYASKSWRTEARELAQTLEALGSAGPRPLQEAFDFLHRFGLASAAERVAKRLAADYPRSGRTRVARDQGVKGPGGALMRAKVLETLWKEAPDRLDAIRKAFDLTLAAGSRAEATRLMEEVAAFRPADPWLPKARRMLAAGHPGDALKDASDAPTRDPGMRRLRRFVSPEASVFAKIDDGRDAVEKFRRATGGEEPSPYSAFPVVTLVDRSEWVVGPAGDVWSLTHVVRLVQTKSGVDRVGEIRPPKGSRLLELRTLKADGRTLWPERIAGKSDVSFSNLEPGDAVEWAWIQHERVSLSEGGYLTGLAFTQWGTPTWKKLSRVTLPPGLALSIRRRNDAPAPTVVVGPEGRTVYTWKSHDLAATPREPRAASARHFFPFVDLAVAPKNATTDTRDQAQSAFLHIQRAYADALRTRLKSGRRVAAAAARFSRGKSPQAGLKAAAQWVQKEIRNTERFNRFGLSLEQSLARRKGNRSLVFTGIAQAMGAQPELLLCAPSAYGRLSDADSPVPNANRYWMPVVKVADGTLVDLSDPRTPYGTLSPSLAGAACFSATRVQDRFETRVLPATQPGDVAWHLDLRVNVKTDGTADLHFEGSGWGPPSNALREVYARSDAKRRDLIWRQWVHWMVPGALVVSTKISGDASPDTPFVFKVHARSRTLFTPQGTKLFARNVVGSLWARHFKGLPALRDLSVLPDRETPLRVDAHGETFALHVRAPAGWQLATGLASGTVTTPTGNVLGEQHVEIRGGTLHMNRTLRLAGSVVEPQDYAAFRAAVLRAQHAWNGPITLSPPTP